VAKKKALRRRAAKVKKRPTDINELAHYLGVLSTEADLRPSSDLVPPSASEVSRVMAALGRKGGKIGGKKRAESMTSQKRKQIATKAARARWDKNKRG
jgi:hypothetical protein